MEVTKDALLKIVKAARTSMRMAEDMKALLVRTNVQTIPDEIAGALCDALFNMCGEQLTCKQDFLRDSDTVRLLNSKMCDGDVTTALMALEVMNHHPSVNKQPVPVTCSNEEFDRMYKVAGGYKFGSTEVDS